MAAQTWTTDWEGHTIEVSYHWEALRDQIECVLRIDGQVAQQHTDQFWVPWDGLHLHGQLVLGGGVCTHKDCGHANAPGARYCARCGRENQRGVPVRAELEGRLVRVDCRIYVAEVCLLDSRDA